MKKVTEQDFRKEEFIGKDPEDYEFRPDGAIVRKDRWEKGVKSVAYILGFNMRDGFEIDDVIAEVELVKGLPHISDIPVEAISNASKVLVTIRPQDIMAIEAFLKRLAR